MLCRIDTGMFSGKVRAATDETVNDHSVTIFRLKHSSKISVSLYPSETKFLD